MKWWRKKYFVQNVNRIIIKNQLKYFVFCLSSILKSAYRWWWRLSAFLLLFFNEWISMWKMLFDNNSNRILYIFGSIDLFFYSKSYINIIKIIITHKTNKKYRFRCALGVAHTKKKNKNRNFIPRLSSINKINSSNSTNNNNKHISFLEMR